MLPLLQRGRLSAVAPVFASKCRFFVNQKRKENFEVGNTCLSR
jgi:hypothetical protein